MIMKLRLRQRATHLIGSPLDALPKTVKNEYSLRPQQSSSGPTRHVTFDPSLSFILLPACVEFGYGVDDINYLVVSEVANNRV